MNATTLRLQNQFTTLPLVLHTSVFFRFFTLFEVSVSKETVLYFVNILGEILQLDIIWRFRYGLIRRAFTVFGPLLTTHQLHQSGEFDS